MQPRAVNAGRALRVHVVHPVEAVVGRFIHRVPLPCAAAGSISSPSKTPSAWDRRRAEMRHRIARHAVDLTLELGSNHVTLEAICERSTISHRTFYNHFDTKEAAIVGDGPTLPSEEALAAFHASDNDDILSDLLTAVISSHSGIGAGTDSDHELDRAILIRKEPSLTDP